MKASLGPETVVYGECFFPIKLGFLGKVSFTGSTKLRFLGKVSFVEGNKRSRETNLWKCLFGAKTRFSEAFVFG